MVAAKQESIPWQSFVFDASWSSTIRNTSLGPLVKGGWAMTIFNFTTIRRRRSVSAWGRLIACRVPYRRLAVLLLNCDQAPMIATSAPTVSQIAIRNSSFPLNT